MFRKNNNRDFAPRGGESSPVKVGEVLDVKIESVGAKGDGVAKKSGFVLFVPGTAKDDEVRVKVTKVMGKFGYAEVVSGDDAADESSEEAPEESGDDYGESSEESEDFNEEASEEDKEDY